MLLKTTEDFRSPLEKATQAELAKFAKARGVSEINPAMPAPLMREILKAKGIIDIHVHFPNLLRRTLGQQRGVNASPFTAKPATTLASQVDVAEDLARQWTERQARDTASRVPTPAPTEVRAKNENAMAALRAECKRRGIAMSRTDKMADLRAKLDGKDASELRQ